MKRLLAASVASVCLLGSVMFGVGSAGAAPLPNSTTVTPIVGTQMTYGWSLASDDTYVWAADNAGGTGGTGKLLRIDITTSDVTTINDSSFNGPKGIASSGTKVVISNFDGNSVSVVDVATSQVTEVTSSDFVKPFAVIWDGANFWVANDVSSTSGPGLVELDANGNVVGSVTDPSLSPYNYGFNSIMSPDGTYLWVGSKTPNGSCGGGCLIKVRLSDRSVVDVLTYSNVSAPDVVFVAGGKVYLADDSFYSSINIFDPASNSWSDVTDSNVIDDWYSAASDGTTLYVAQTNGCPTLQCIPALSTADASLSQFTNSTFQSHAAGHYGALTWARGCLWWLSAYAAVDPALLRICDSPTPPPTTTTTAPTTTTTAAGLAKTGGSVTPLLALSGGLLLLGVALRSTVRRRVRKA